MSKKKKCRWETAVILITCLLFPPFQNLSRARWTMTHFICTFIVFIVSIFEDFNQTCISKHWNISAESLWCPEGKSYEKKKWCVCWEKWDLLKENSEGFSSYLAPARLQSRRGREPAQRCLAASLSLNHSHPHLSFTAGVWSIICFHQSERDFENSPQIQKCFILQLKVKPCSLQLLFISEKLRFVWMLDPDSGMNE